VLPHWVTFDRLPVQELTTEAEWTREEKLSQVAQLLKEQMQQHAFIKLGTETTQPLLVPFLKDYGLPEQSLLEYQREVYDQQGALAAIEVDRLLAESHHKFLADAADAIAIPPDEDRSAPPSEVLPTTRDAIKQAGPGEIPGWNRGPRSDECAGKQLVPRKSPGPLPDIENHLKVAKIVSQYGDAWDTDEKLFDICTEMDDQQVPVPKPWWARPDIKAQTWKTALRNKPAAVRRAIRDHIRAAEKAKKDATGPELSPTSTSC
jgi:hypothetical protein